MSTGRDALAKAAGGGPDGCRDPKTLMGYGISHIIIDQVITPTETGASGKAILLAIGVGGNPTTIERQGGYEDTYVKTARAGASRPASTSSRIRHNRCNTNIWPRKGPRRLRQLRQPRRQPNRPRHNKIAPSNHPDSR